MSSFLFITNGHGEDLVAKKMIEGIPKDIKSSVFPLSGDGKVFEGLGVPILGTRKRMPSGGFSLRNILYLPRDLKEGFLQNSLIQLGGLKNKKGQFDLVIAIGDLVPLIGALFTRTDLIFVGVNKSDYYRSFGYSYTPWEKYLLKKHAKRIFVRDLITASNLLKQKIPAEYVGNPLMDCLEPFTQKPKDKHQRIVGFLPGTRAGDVELNLKDFEKIADFLLKFDRKMLFYAATRYPTPKILKARPFEETIYSSDIIIGLSGTGNEQAAGIGKPVVSFPGRGSQYSKKFAKAQKQLLGIALSVVPREKRRVAEEVWEILEDKGRYSQMSHEGLARMGKTGAIKRIVACLLEGRKWK